MQPLIGVLFLIGGIAGLLLARPQNGKIRSFVNTNMEIPIVLTILGAFAIGMVLTIRGVALAL